MKKVPSYLKGLAETHARSAGDVQRLEKVLIEVNKKLLDAKAELAACDRLIRKFDTRLNPNLIVPINAWMGRYGKRGELRKAVCKMLKDCAPGELTTLEIAWEIQLTFKLDFQTTLERRTWHKNSLGRTLNALHDRGVVERLHDISEGPNGEVGRWRWKSEINTLDELRAQAAAQGVGTQQVPEEDACSVEKDCE